MGGGLSIGQNNFQETSTNVNQSSQASCINTYVEASDISITANNSTLNNLNNNQSILNNSSTCALKASLDSSIINKLKSTQKATQVDVPGPFTILSDLLGAGDSISQNNTQVISNQATQAMNSLCQNNDTTSKNVAIIVNNTTVNDLNLSNLIKNNKTNCVIENTSKFFAQNDETNSQTATQVRISMFVVIALVIAIGCIGVAAIKYGFKSKKEENSNVALEETELNDINKSNRALVKMELGTNNNASIPKNFPNSPRTKLIKS